MLFDVELDDGRIASCWQAVEQGYSDCVFSAGLVSGIEPDTVYFRLRRDLDEEPLTLFMRPDEMLAAMFVCSGALWSERFSQKTGELDVKQIHRP